MDGWTLARELRLRATEVPLVVMTAAAQEARRWAEEISATAYLPKPLDPSVLLATLDDICARS
jgi:CheY-like chemotaxis protein